MQPILLVYIVLSESSSIKTMACPFGSMFAQTKAEIRARRLRNSTAQNLTLLSSSLPQKSGRDCAHKVSIRNLVKPEGKRSSGHEWTPKWTSTVLEGAGECRFLFALVGLILNLSWSNIAAGVASISVLAAQRFGEQFGVYDSFGSCPIPTLASQCKPCSGHRQVSCLISSRHFKHGNRRPLARSVIDSASNGLRERPKWDRIMGCGGMKSWQLRLSRSAGTVLLGG